MSEPKNDVEPFSPPRWYLMPHIAWTIMQILAGRNFGEWANSPISVQFGGISFVDLKKTSKFSENQLGGMAGHLVNLLPEQ